MKVSGTDVCRHPGEGTRKGNTSNTPETHSPNPRTLATSLEILAEAMVMGSRDCVWLWQESIEVGALGTWQGLVSTHAKDSSSYSGAEPPPSRHSVSLLTYSAVAVFTCMCIHRCISPMNSDGQELGTHGQPRSLVRSNGGDS